MSDPLRHGMAYKPFLSFWLFCSQESPALMSGLHLLLPEPVHSRTFLAVLSTSHLYPNTCSDVPSLCLALLPRSLDLPTERHIPKYLTSNTQTMLSPPQSIHPDVTCLLISVLITLGAPLLSLKAASESFSTQQHHHMTRVESDVTLPCHWKTGPFCTPLRTARFRSTNAFRDQSAAQNMEAFSFNIPDPGDFSFMVQVTERTNKRNSQMVDHNLTMSIITFQLHV